MNLVGLPTMEKCARFAIVGTPILATQVELSLYLPLRRCLWKELMLRLKGDVR